MKTRKPLRALIPDILLYFNRYVEQLQFDLELYKMYEGQIKEKVKESLYSELFSKAAYNRAIQRIPSINIPHKVTDKLSKVYAEPPIRFSEEDQDLMEEFAKNMHVNAKMGFSNKMTNLNKRCALEIFVQDEVQRLRVLTAHQFFPFSDSPTSPNEMTVFCKLLGKEQITNEVVIRRDGTRTATDEVTLVDIIALYSETEFLIIDSSGSVRADKMAEMGITSEKNPFGVIPFVYINKSLTELMPFPNQTAHDMGILIPKLLTDLNYSAQFLSHSVIWTKNTDMTGSEINPDSVVNLGDNHPDGSSPEIGVIKPETDIDGVLKLIEFELSAYLSTEGLKAGSIGQLEASNAASGVAKIMDESDATEARKEQTELYRMVEPDFWFKFAKMQEYWSKNAKVTKKETFSDGFIEKFSIKFAEIKPLESEKEKYEKMKVARELKLITKKQALRELYPNLPMPQLEERLAELEDELAEEKKEMMSMGLTPGFTQKAEQQVGKSPEKIAQQAENGGTKPK